MKKLIFVILGIIALIGAGFLAINVITPQSPAGTVPTTKSIKLGKIPSDANIIFWSTRSIKNTGKLGPGNWYVMNKDGGNVTQITFDPKPYEHAEISFDRKRIVANTNDSKRSRLWVLNLEKQTETQLLPDFYSVGSGGVDVDPAGFIYFVGAPKENIGQNVYKIKPDGSELTQITFWVQRVPPDPNPESGSFSDLSVSEDGSMIAVFHSQVKKTGTGYVGQSQIWVMNSDGTNQRLIDDAGPEAGKDTSGADIGDYDPEISPDNKYVIFSRTNTQNKNFKDSINTAHDLWIAPLDKLTPARRLTQEGPISIIPDWHGNTILYTEYNEKENYVGLVTINPDGTGKKQLESHPNNIWDGGRHGKFMPPYK